MLLDKVKSPSRSIIDGGVIITGTVACTGELEILGQIQGDLHCATLLVAQSGHIRGDVFAENAQVDGRVDGAIRGRQIVLGTSAHVTGDIHHSSLVIEHGAIFEGKVRRSNNPTQLEPAPQHVPGQASSAPHSPTPQPVSRHPEPRRERGQAAQDGQSDLDPSRWPRQLPVTQ